ncbi:hypothetical protein [Candidatus Palauibacter sp.]|uniref:hypothetical protein n=1 Tax=Candidatus Palauibacter sp. TaxID=3101350 RepID=UPI003AF2CDF6
MQISVGDRVEPFTLAHEAGGTIDLADHLGRERIVLLCPTSTAPFRETGASCTKS